MHRISIPKGARAVLLNLRYENHEAYVVGGCVRDSLLGKEPKDWDICTSATPDEVAGSVNVLHSKQSIASVEARARNAQCQQTT